MDPQLVALPEKSRSWRSGSLALLAALAIHGSQAQDAPGTPEATEQAVVPTRADASPRFNAAKSGPSEIGMKEDGAYCKKLEPAPQRRPRYQIFVSGRFPFIHVRQRVVRGKIRITGCPSF